MFPATGSRQTDKNKSCIHSLDTQQMHTFNTHNNFKILPPPFDKMPLHACWANLRAPNKKGLNLFSLKSKLCIKYTIDNNVDSCRQENVRRDARKEGKEERKR